MFKKDGTTTAGTFLKSVLSLQRDTSLYLKLEFIASCVPSQTGNSSQVSDGAGAVLLMKRSLATQKGLPVLGVFRSVILFDKASCDVHLHRYAKNILDNFAGHLLRLVLIQQSWVSVQQLPFLPQLRRLV